MWVYIMTNASRRPFYTGVTGDLDRRVAQHKNDECDYTSHYRLYRLVYYETWRDPRSAIAREKQIQGLTRLKKMQLVVSMNPEWKDLSIGWPGHHRFEPERPVWRKRNP
jgi:putative endonuclease